jgi:hypothetical protein
MPGQRPAGIEHRGGLSPKALAQAGGSGEEKTRMIIQKVEGANRAPRDRLEAEANGHCRGPCVCHSQRLYMDVKVDQ